MRSPPSPLPRPTWTGSRALWALACLIGSACSAAPWTARLCASNDSGNCRGTDDAQGHSHDVHSTGVGPVHGLNDIDVKEPACTEGIGKIDVEVLDRDDLRVTVYCLSDRPHGTMTLPPPAPEPNPAPATPTSSNP